MSYFVRKYWSAKWHQYDKQNKIPQKLINQGIKEKIKSYIKKYFCKECNNNDVRISADAITNCLKTQKNTLSLWKVNDIKNIDNEGALAIIGTMDSIASIDIIIFSNDELNSLGLELKDTNGNTIVADLQKTHSDIINLDTVSLTEFSNHIYKKIHEEEIKREIVKDKISHAERKNEHNNITPFENELEILMIKRYTASDVKKIIKNAIKNGRIRKEDLQENIQKKIFRL